MRLQKLLFPFGMISALFFFLFDFLGTVLWKGYNPIVSPVSQLIADGAPNVLLTRTLFYSFEVSLVVFFLGLLIQSFQSHGACLRTGYSVLFLLSVVSLFGYKLFPMTMDFIINVKNYLHAVVTIVIFVGTMGVLFLLALGYRKQEKNRRLGRITFTAAVLFLLFNLLQYYVMIRGLPVGGLVERLTLYTFQIYIFVLSWFYVKRRVIYGRFS